ncbi:MAG: aldehyde dehydrogenase family protein, partial [Thermomicrobiales bacterium]
MTKRHPMFLAGEWAESADPIDIVNPFNGETLGTTFQASREQVEAAIVAAQSVFPSLRATPVYDRVSLLKALAAKLKERRDEVARTIALEAGKPIRDAEIETDRGVFTLETAAEEAKRIEGEVIPLD